MSAFIVSTTHIHFLIAAGLRFARRNDPLHIAPFDYTDADGEKVVASNLTEETADAIGQMLEAENRRSVDHRYSESNVVELYRFDTRLLVYGKIEPIAVLKAIACYEYQSCEHDEWGTSFAKKFCDALRLAAIHALPGYEQAAWGVDSIPGYDPSSPKPISLSSLAKGKS